MADSAQRHVLPRILRVLIIDGLVSPLVLPVVHFAYNMPMNDKLKMAGPGEYAHKRLGDSFAPPPAGKRSSTPQPQHAKSHQRANEASERLPRSKSRDATSREVISAQQAAILKVPVRNTLCTGPKPLRTHAVQQTNPIVASVAQHKKSFGGSHIQPQREVGAMHFLEEIRLS